MATHLSEIGAGKWIWAEHVFGARRGGDLDVHVRISGVGREATLNVNIMRQHKIYNVAR